MYQKLINQLIKDEGIKLKPYKDSVGKLTIGIGRNLIDRGITKEEAILLLANDIKIVKREIKKIFPKFSSYTERRQLALMNMYFNLGYNKFSTFKRMIKAIKEEDWQQAGIEALKSRWAKQVGNRAINIANDIVRG